MNIKGRGFRLAVTGDHTPFEVADEKAGRGDLAKRVSIGVDEKEIVVARDDCREMIANPFLVTPLRRKPKACGKLDARLHDGVGIEPDDTRGSVGAAD
jgi:hypothetical protein